MKILMVCLGNICRSPLAEGILKAKTNELGLNWEIDSAGTGAYHVGELPDYRSIKVAKSHGVDISDQRARKFTANDFENFDLILVMDSSNYQNVSEKAMSSTDEKKIELIMNYADPGMNTNVPDPYWNDNGFEQVFQMLDRACDELIKSHS